MLLSTGCIYKMAVKSIFHHESFVKLTVIKLNNSFVTLSLLFKEKMKLARPDKKVWDDRH